MGVIAKQSIKGALANYLGVLIGAVTTFFVVTDLLTREEIGLTRVMVDAAMLFAERYGELDEYAKLRGMTEDEMRDKYLSDVGLDERGGELPLLGRRLRHAERGKAGSRGSRQ